MRPIVMSEPIVTEIYVHAYVIPLRGPAPSLTAVVLEVTPAIVAARVEPSKLISCTYIK
jgi:hypothetical protein